MNVEQIARICHEINRAYCAAVGDQTQQPWHEAEQWQRDSAMQGVKAAVALGDAARPDAQHEAWLADKQANGWQWGPIKDPALKLHPCMRPYDELPLEQKVKDHLFLAVVRALTEGVE